MASSSQHEENTFFVKERDRLTAEITSGFEELLSNSNNVNRKLEEVLGMTREYETIAELWQSFQDLMRGRPSETYHVPSPETSIQGLPGTGGHVLATSGKEEDHERTE